MIHEYRYNPLDELDFAGKPLLKLFLGVELEVTTPNYDRDSYGQVNLAATVEKVLEDFAIVKHDGSISTRVGINRGFEIATAPASLTVHRKAWGKFFAALDDEDSDLCDQIGTNGTCGLHVHVSKAPFVEAKRLDKLGELVAFVTDPKQEGIIVKLAGRNNTGYASLLKKSPEVVKHIGCKDNPCYICQMDRSKHPRRLEAVNLLPADTFEFRLFAATLYPDEFFMRLEFAAALSVWFLSSLAATADAPFTVFTDWLNDNHANRYPALVRYLSTQSSTLRRAVGTATNR